MSRPAALPVTAIPCVADPDFWFTDKTGNGARQDIKNAIAICNTCPVIEACRENALRLNAIDRIEGVWGGMYFRNPHKKRLEKAS